MKQEVFEKRKETIYELICSDHYVPMKIKEIAILLQIPRENREELKEVLDSLIADGKVEVSKKGKYTKAESRILTGEYTGHPRGFGFVSVEGEEEDIFIPEGAQNGALHKDTVQVALVAGRKGKRREGSVTKVLAHGITELVGTFQKNKNYGFVIADNLRISKDIYVAPEHSKGAVNGHKVVVSILNYGGVNRSPEGKITEILGHVNDPGTDIMSIVRGYELPVEFPEKVMNQAGRVPGEVSEADMQGRLDLRDWQMVTIDGEEAKDLDDAVSVFMEGDNYRLGVHIADVANYVQENSALDREAYKRGTSVYLVDRVIPMLPHALSNGICSLNAGTDRLALSCIMLIDPRGRVIDHQIAETVIHVDQRMSYTDVAKILVDQEEEQTKKYEKLLPMFRQMEELAGILREKRRKRGSIDFDFPESKIILDEKGKPVDIRPYDRNVATKIIEDFMLIANETVAEDFYWQEIPFVYRTHDHPDPEKIEKLGLFINNFGYAIHIGRDEIHPKEVQKLLSRIDGTPEETLISRLALRSMKQAKYTSVNSGHFGLAAPYYCHFTSPIRRYPDLQIHRIIKETLRGRMKEERLAHYEKLLPEAAKHSSETERRADEAERETDKLKKVEYMEARMGQEFDGVISSITGWGFYVELPNTVEGLVHVTHLYDDRYFYKEEKFEMVGDKTHRTFKLGQRVRVRVIGTDRLQRTIDFELAMEDNREEEWTDNEQGEYKADRQ